MHSEGQCIHLEWPMILDNKFVMIISIAFIKEPCDVTR